MNLIRIRGAKEHNLKNISLDIPRNKLVTFVGLSGSGKSTLAIDLIANEGQRQYINSLSTYAARLLNRAARPDVDAIEGISPTILVEQRQIQASPRSTVGTVTEIYTLMRLLFSREGSENLSAGHFSFNNPEGACLTCKGTGVEITVDVDILVDFDKTLNEGAIKHSNYVRPDTRLMNILKTTGKIPFDVPLKKLTKEQLNFLLYSPQVKLKNDTQGFVQSYSWEGVVNRIIKRTKDERGLTKSKEKTDGQFRTYKECSTCNGYRLNPISLSSLINEKNIGELSSLPITSLITEVQNINNAKVPELKNRMLDGLQSLVSVGIGYLSLNRSTNTLSGGEAQRVKLAKELNSELVEMIYVLDEPTAGLHPRDVSNIIKILKDIRDKENSVLVVEHDPEVINQSDYLIELGPKAGKLGGEIVFEGTPAEIKKSTKSVTGKYLKDDKKSSLQSKERTSTNTFNIKNANLHNLKDLSVDIPVGIFTAVTGVSGSGKSTLINDIFARKFSSKVVTVDQSAIGASPRGNIVTYTGTFDFIRDAFAIENKVSKALFSSNSEGACPKCNGLGYIKMDMHFMADVKTVCDECKGKKYTEKVLSYKYKNKNIDEVLSMTAIEALEFFQDINITKRLDMLLKVGLDYLELGQTLDTLSGGESQRLKLASKLHEKGNFFVLDEPTSGLHPADIEKLLVLLHNLVDAGNSVLVIEHNLDIIKSADWIIDLGPEGGDKGGTIVAQGTPKEVAQQVNSYTGQYLKQLL